MPRFRMITKSTMMIRRMRQCPMNRSNLMKLKPMKKNPVKTTSQNLTHRAKSVKDLRELPKMTKMIISHNLAGDIQIFLEMLNYIENW